MQSMQGVIVAASPAGKANNGKTEFQLQLNVTKSDGSLV